VNHITIQSDIGQALAITGQNAAKYSQGEIDLVWVLVGEGEDLSALKRAVEDPIRSEISERSSAL
jgi:hypothetical protein